MHCDSDDKLSWATEQQFSFGKPKYVPFLSTANVSDLGLESQERNCGLALVCLHVCICV